MCIKGAQTRFIPILRGSKINLTVSNANLPIASMRQTGVIKIAETVCLRDKIGSLGSANKIV